MTPDTKSALTQPKEIANRAVALMQAFHDQMDEHDDLIKENATLRAQRDLFKRDVASTKTELAEVMREVNTRKSEYQELYRQLDQFNAEIKQKTTLRDKLNAEVQALRQKYFGG